jgi:SAP domain
MATHGYGQAADTTNALKADIKSLTVDRLKNILRSESLTVSGVKSELQIRLIACK